MSRENIEKKNQSARTGSRFGGGSKQTLAAFSCLIIAAGVVVSCKGKIEADVVNAPSLNTNTATATATDSGTTVSKESTTEVPAPQTPSLPKLTGLDRLAAKSGEVVKLSGQNFKDYKDLEVSIGGKLVPLSISPDGSAEFTMPEVVSPGMGDVKLVSKTLGELGQATMLADAGDYPISTMAPEKVCKGESFRNAKGEVLVGTLECGPRPSCSATLRVDCTATGDFQSVAKSELIPGFIKSGASIGGVTGIYPSSAAPLAANTSSADLTSFGATTPVGLYEFFDSAGNVYSATVLDGGTITPGVTSQSLSSAGSLYRGVTVSGDANLLATNIKSGVSIFGLSGSLTPAPSNCTSAAQTGCVTTSTYKSMDLSQVGASSATGLTAANFETKLASAANFEFWDASGARHIKAGDVDLTTANVKDTVVIFGTTGTLTGAPVNCSSNGSQSCVATGTYYAATACAADGANCFVPTYVITTQPLKAISYDSIDAGKASIRSSLTLSGITGTLATCSTNNTTGCVTTAPYNSADWTNLTAANIKSGASVAGLTGTYPSSGNLLTGADGTADLDTATFDAKVKSASSFEFFGPDGTRYTNTGDTDITVSNIANSVTIFGTTGSANVLTQCTSGSQATCESDTACRWNASACEINPWHIRAGITVASKAGSLKANCRNTINNTYFNWDGSVASLPTSAQTGGTAYDFWDTIDDFYGYPANRVTAWSSNTQCDSSNWTDVTTTNGGTSLTSCGTSSTCIYRDELSGLRVTGILSSGNNTTNTASPATYTWSAAINACNGSTYGGYSAGTWRLPTQKELMSLYEHGVVSRVGASFHILGNLQNYYWSSSGYSFSTGAGWVVLPAFGRTYDYTKTSSFYALCVF